MEYHIYGRKVYERPLTFIQTLTIAQSLQQEVVQAMGRDGWVELVAIPSHALIHVIGQKQDA
jgi:hypothetical protein